MSGRTWRRENELNNSVLSKVISVSGNTLRLIMKVRQWWMNDIHTFSKRIVVDDSPFVVQKIDKFSLKTELSHWFGAWIQSDGFRADHGAVLKRKKKTGEFELNVFVELPQVQKSIGIISVNFQSWFCESPKCLWCSCFRHLDYGYWLSHLREQWKCDTLKGISKMCDERFRCSSHSAKSLLCHHEVHHSVKS
jgi:hypothetical protein